MISDLKNQLYQKTQSVRSQDTGFSRS